MYTTHKITISRAASFLTDTVFRQKYASYISHAVEANTHTELPYFNATDEFWVLDSRNDWFLRFYENEPASFSIESRYHDLETEEALVAINKWIAYRLGGKLESKTI